VTDSFARRVARRLVRLLRPEQPAPAQLPNAVQKRDKHLWSIGLYEGASPLALGPSARAANPVLTRDDVTDARAAIVADPFLARDGEETHLFFEILDAERMRGEIALATSRDLSTWTYRQVVLREPFHLSYPFVFAWEGAWYMIPETNQARSVRLYRATDFPTRWEHVHTLLSGAPFSDATLLRHDDRWWLFTDPSPPFHNSTLALYHSDDLFGDWTPHPRSPLVANDKRSSRPAGRLIRHDGRLYRVAQDCAPHYGMAVRAFEILTLTTTEYEERPASPDPLLGASGAGWNAEGMHHVDALPLGDGRWIAAVDGWRWATAGEVFRRGE
jgi:hypothetical protein